MADRANIAPAEVLYRSRRDDAHHRVYMHHSEENSVRDELSHRQETLMFLPENIPDSHNQPCHIQFEDVPPDDDDNYDYPPGYDPNYVPDPEAPTDYPCSSSWTNPFAAQTDTLFSVLTEGGEEIPESFKAVAKAFPKFEEAAKIHQDTPEAIEFAAVHEMMTEDFGNNEVQDDSDSDSSSTTRRKRKQKQKQKKRVICKNCYPDREYKEFEAVQAILLSPEAKIPFRATNGAAGYDLTSIATYVIPPQERMLISTGLALEIPPGTYGRIAPRSGLALQNGINIGVGVIDPDYRGEIKVLLFNLDKRETFIVHPGDRIAQIIFEEISYPRMVMKDALDPCDEEKHGRGNQGFGSTGTASEQQGWNSDSNPTPSDNIIAMLEEQEFETEYPQIKKLEQLIAKHSAKDTKNEIQTQDKNIRTRKYSDLYSNFKLQRYYTSGLLKFSSLVFGTSLDDLSYWFLLVILIERERE
ncbi:hypothetical protein CsSME_00001242 [Camellia sinensis var. sinensis]